MSRDAFSAEFDVPRGTIAALDAYVALLIDWQSRINLVGPATLPNIWDRHIRDSAQLTRFATPGGTWLDIGAGAGFPGLVLAALLPNDRFTLVESVAKKARFLQTIAETMEITDRVTIANIRVEALSPFEATRITARACAALPQLFDWGLRFATASTLWLLPKGERVADEMTAARARFAFDAELVPSLTAPDARIVVARGVKRL